MALRLKAHFMEAALQAKRIEDFDGIGAQVDARTKGAQLGGLLVHLDFEALLPERNSGGQAAKSGPNNGNTIPRRHAILDDSQSGESIVYRAIKRTGGG